VAVLLTVLLSGKIKSVVVIIIEKRKGFAQPRRRCYFWFIHESMKVSLE